MFSSSTRRFSILFALLIFISSLSPGAFGYTSRHVDTRPSSRLGYRSSPQTPATMVVSDRYLSNSNKHRMQKSVSQFSRLPTKKKALSTSANQASQLLSREEEVRYSFQIRTFRAAVRMRDSLVKQSHSMYIHPTETEWASACGTSVLELRRVMHDGQEARSMLVSANVGLVTSIAKRHYYALKHNMAHSGGVGTILTMQDLIQEGNLGLMEAAERFEPEKGVRFSTYATWWVRQRIFRSISDSSRIIRLPAHVHGTLLKIQKAKAQLHLQTGKEPSDEELADVLAMSVDKLKRYAKTSRHVVSLESKLRTPSYKEDSQTLGDTLRSDAPTPEEDAEASYLRQDIRLVMDTELSTSERDVILHRFGLDDGKSRTMDETAQLLGLTRDRVRVVEARALNKLRHPQRNYRLKEYVTADTANEEESATKKDINVVDGGIHGTSDRIWFF